MENFDPTQVAAMHDSVQQLLNDVMVWIGFGTVVGMLAKGIMPGRDPGGAIVTILLGIGGTILGCGIASYFNHGQRVVPVSPLGIFMGILGTLAILSAYKIFSSTYFVEGEYVTQSRRQQRRIASRRRHYDSVAYED